MRRNLWKFSAPLLSRSSFNGYTKIHALPTFSWAPKLSFNKTHRLLGRPNKFIASAFRNMETLVKVNLQLEEALESAETIEQFIDLINRTVLCDLLTEREFGFAILNTGLKLYREGEDPEKALHFANTVLTVLKKYSYSYLPVAITLQLLGSLNYSLKRFDHCLSNLIEALSLLDDLKCERDDDSDDDLLRDINDVQHDVQLELAKVYTAKGRRNLALENLRQSLQIKEILEADKSELGKRNCELASNYVAVLNFKQALPYCLKALEIHNELLGQNSVEVALDRKLLGLVYSGLGEHEKALEQNIFAQRTLKNWNLDSDLLQAKIDAANMMIALGRHDEAVCTLKNMVLQTGKDNETQALVLISMAKALCNQEKFADCKRCLEISLGILDKREKISPLEVAKAYTEISMQYETMYEFENAISLLKRALALLERHPQEQHSLGRAFAGIGWLQLLIGKIHSATFYLEVAIKRLKDSLGFTHFGLSYAYNNLGVGYLELDRPISAVQMFTAAKDIMDVSIGPHHVDAIEPCLSRAWGEVGSSVIAFEFQHKLIDALESHGASTEFGRREARQLLQQLQKKACGASASANDLPIKALPLPEPLQHLGSPNLTCH